MIKANKRVEWDGKTVKGKISRQQSGLMTMDDAIRYRRIMTQRGARNVEIVDS